MAIINFLDNEDKKRKDAGGDERRFRGEDVAWTEPEEAGAGAGDGAPDYKNYRAGKSAKFPAGKKETAPPAEDGGKDPSGGGPEKRFSFFGRFGKERPESERSGVDAEKNEERPAGPGKKESDVAAPAAPGAGKRDAARRKFSFGAQAWTGPKVLTTNLVGEEGMGAFDWKKNIMTLAVNIISASLIIAAVYGGLAAWERYAKRESELLVGESAALALKIIALEREIDEVMVDEFGRKLKLARSLLDRHIYWSNFFSLLERNTMKDVYYSGKFSGDTSGEYKMETVAKSFQAVADQIKIMRLDENITDVSVAEGEPKGGSGGSKPEETGVHFNLGLKVRPEVFKK